MTAIRPAQNAVVVQLSRDADDSDRRQLENERQQQRAKVTLEEKPASYFDVNPKACGYPGYPPAVGGQPAGLPYCDRPLRGGVYMASVTTCTPGFIVFGANYRFVMTAGHCIEPNGIQDYWGARTWPSQDAHPIGPAHSYNYGGRGNRGSEYRADAGLIRIDMASFWDQVIGQYAVLWSGDSSHQLWPAAETAWPYPGLFTCGSGYAGGLQCGWLTVIHINNVGIDDNGDGIADTWVDAMSASTGCVRQGDSGSPLLSGYVGYGILSAGAGLPGQPGCYSLYYPVRAAEHILNAPI